jgi:hypothetical protein
MPDGPNAAHRSKMLVVSEPFPEPMRHLDAMAPILPFRAHMSSIMFTLSESGKSELDE